MNVTLFVKKNKPTTWEVVTYLKKHCVFLQVFEGEQNDVFPEKACACRQDLLISYLSPWILPPALLEKTRLWNINFHPGPPEYPGIGCFNFAIYHREETYGVTAHLMDKTVDSGTILGVRRFAVSDRESVYSLSMKTYEQLFKLFSDIMDSVMKKKLPRCNESWRRKPLTRKQLEALCMVDCTMAKEEIERRIHATDYPHMPGAYINVHGHIFEYKKTGRGE